MKKLKEKLNEKLSKNGGFTLVEMLIVVAIIAILIAVSVPLVNSALEDAREATDEANARNAVALATIKVLQENITADDEWTYGIDGGTGVLDSGTTYKSQSDAYNKGAELKVEYKAAGDGKVTAKFGDEKVTFSPTT